MPEPIPSPDLDRAFDDLVRDVDTLTHRRGADAAVRTARRRRTTAVAGIAAAAVLLAGGLGWALLPGGASDSDGTPVATDPGLPEPDPFTGRDLGEAYGSVWTTGPAPAAVLTDPICVPTISAEPEADAGRELRTDPPVGQPGTWAAMYVYVRFADVPTTSRTAETISESWSQCDVPPEEHLLDVGPEASAYVASYPAADGNAARDQLVVQAGDRLALLTVAKDPRLLDPRPIDVGAATALATDLLAGLLHEEKW